MNSESKDPLIKELVLALAALTAWDDNADHNAGKDPVYRSWKSFDWNSLNALMEAGLIEHKPKSKTLFLNAEGMEKGKALVEKVRAALAEG